MRLLRSRRARRGARPTRGVAGSGSDAWRSLYAGGPPRADGSIGRAQLAARRRMRHRVWASVVGVLAVLGVVAYLTVPRWVYNAGAYSHHVLGPYADQLPSSLRHDLDTSLPALQKFVEQRRGHAFPGAPQFIYLPPGPFRNEVDKEVGFDQYDFVAGPTFRALGWLGDASRLGTLRLNLQTQGIVAFYGRFDGNIYLGGQRLNDAARAEVVRALTSALDDALFNTAYALNGTEHDRRLAVQALVDGDAVEVERAWVERLPTPHRCDVASAVALFDVTGCPATASESGSDDAPAAVTALVLFPERYGPTFVEALRAKGGNAAIDRALNDPPQSTQNVLSPADYLAGIAPHTLAYPPHQGSLIDFGTLGDYAISLMLAKGRPAEAARDHVAAWRGDSYSTYTVAGKTCVRDLVLLSDAAAARSFAARARSAGATANAAGADATWIYCSR